MLLSLNNDRNKKVKTENRKFDFVSHFPLPKRYYWSVTESIYSNKVFPSRDNILQESYFILFYNACSIFNVWQPYPACLYTWCSVTPLPILVRYTIWTHTCFVPAHGFLDFLLDSIFIVTFTSFYFVLSRISSSSFSRILGKDYEVLVILALLHMCILPKQKALCHPCEECYVHNINISFNISLTSRSTICYKTMQLTYTFVWYKL